jgi:hypothetical protein
VEGGECDAFRVLQGSAEPGAALVAGSCRSFPQDSSVEFSFMR